MMQRSYRYAPLIDTLLPVRVHTKKKSAIVAEDALHFYILLVIKLNHPAIKNKTRKSGYLARSDRS